MFGFKHSVEGTLVSALECASVADAWSSDIGAAGLADVSSVLLCHRSLVRHEMLAVASRMTWAAFVPVGWRTMSPGVRIDAIQAIVRSTTTCPPSTAARLAFRLNRLLQAAIDREREHVLTSHERSLLIASSCGRCGICGRGFTKREVDCFLAGKPRLADRSRIDVDRWKPIQSMDYGWTIDVDHVVPLASVGMDEVENFQLTCHYCNSIKREWTSVFDRPPRWSTDDGFDAASRFHALRVLATGKCFECDRSARDVELTVAPHSVDGLFTLQNMFATCYEHDPASKVRWRGL